MITEKAVTSFYESDHDQLDGFLKKYQELKRVDFAQAKPYFREFKFGLTRHIIWEEEILFPVFEQKTGIVNGPTEVMRREHTEIKRLLEVVHEYVRQRNPESDIEEQQLIAVLSIHNQKEEQILYPAIDRLLSDQERGQIFDQMNAVPETRYRVCCGHHHEAAHTK